MRKTRPYIGLILRSLIIMPLLLPCPALSVETETIIATASTKTSTLSGFTRARAKMKIISQVSDHLIEVKSDIGDIIGEDGIFAVIDSTLAKLDLESNLLNQKKLVSKTAYLNKEVERFATLLQQQSTAEAKFDSLEQELDQASLALLNLKNEEEKVREFISRHEVRGKPGWQVISRTAESGEWVTSGRVLAEIGDYRSLIVPFALSQNEYSWIMANSKKLQLWLPEQKIYSEAKILRISPGFDQNTRKLNLELEIRDLHVMRGGIRVELNIMMPDPSGAVIVPEKALSSRYDSFWLTSPDNIRIPVVKLGPGQSDTTVRVSSPDIKVGDKFLLKHNQGNN